MFFFCFNYRYVGLERVQNFRVWAEPSLKFSRPVRDVSKIFESKPSPSLGYQKPTDLKNEQSNLLDHSINICITF